MFHCSDCGISFPSAALLSNHKQRFCRRSRIDLQTQLLLNGQGAQEGPWAQPLPFARVPGGNDDGLGFRARSSGTPTPVCIPSQLPPRSMSAEPPLVNPIQQPHAMMPSFLGYGGPASNPPPQQQPDPPWLQHSAEVPQLAVPTPFMRGYGAPSAAFPAHYAEPQTELYRLLEQQQMQINMLKGMMGAMPQQFNQPQQFEYKAGMGVHGLYGNVIEGRYGIRIYAAEGLLLHP